MNCPYCGRINPDNVLFCPSCGTAVNLPAPKKSSSNVVMVVIAVIVIVVALSVVLSAVMYVMVLGIGGGSPPPMVSMTKSSTADYLVATVVALSGSSMFSLSDMRLIVKNSSGTITLVRSPLSTMVSGVIYDGVMFQGLTPGYLNVGDDFSLDKHLYSPGSSITLTNIAGTAAYGVCSF